LIELPPFEIWFATGVVESQAKGEEVPTNVISLSIPHWVLATAYQSMYAIANHA
jgi:hypothetical protein